MTSILSSTNLSRSDFYSGSTNTSRPQNVVSVITDNVSSSCYGPIYGDTCTSIFQI